MSRDRLREFYGFSDGDIDLFCELYQPIELRDLSIYKNGVRDKMYEEFYKCEELLKIGSHITGIYFEHL